jgi:hypothetical protein
LQSLLQVLQRMFVHLTKTNHEWLLNLLYYTVGPDEKIVYITDPDGSITAVKAGAKDFSANKDNMTIGLRFVLSAVNLIFKENFCVRPVKQPELGALTSWDKSSSTQQIENNRVMVLEFLVSLVFLETKLMQFSNRKANSVLSFLKYSKLYEPTVRSLLFLGCNYHENGLLPYSAYFYKDFMENKLYASALSLNLCLMIIQDDPKSTVHEVRSQRTSSIELQVIRDYLRNEQMQQDNANSPLFQDEPLLLNVLTDIAVNVVSIYQKEKTLLPNSYKEVPSLEPLPRGDDLPPPAAAEQKRKRDHLPHQGQGQRQPLHPPADHPRPGAP